VTPEPRKKPKIEQNSGDSLSMPAKKQVRRDSEDKHESKVAVTQKWNRKS